MNTILVSSLFSLDRGPNVSSRIEESDAPSSDVFVFFLPPNARKCLVLQTYL